MASEEERYRVIVGSQQKFKETLNEATLQEPDEYMTMATFHKKSKNDCNSTVTGSQQGITKKEGSNRKCVIILFVIVFALFLSTAGACVAFILELFNLQNEIQQLNDLRLEMQLNQQNASLDSAYQQLNEQLNTSIDMLNQQLNQQDQQLRQEYTALDNRTQQLNTSTQLLLNSLEGPGGQYLFYPAASCAALPPSSPSGYYWVRASNGSAVSVYCDMTRLCGGVTGGWM